MSHHAVSRRHGSARHRCAGGTRRTRSFNVNSFASELFKHDNVREKDSGAALTIDLDKQFRDLPLRSDAGVRVVKPDLTSTAGTSSGGRVESLEAARTYNDAETRARTERIAPQSLSATDCSKQLKKGTENE